MRKKPEEPEKPKIKFGDIDIEGVVAKVARTRRRPFTGVLVEPVQIPHDILIFSLIDDNPEDKTIIHQSARHIVLQQLEIRFAALAKHYRLNAPETAFDWKRLCYALAKETVPGFKSKMSITKPTSGFKPKDFSVGGNMLVDAIDKQRTAEGGTIRDAAKFLSKNVSPWKEGNASVASLQSQYSKAKVKKKSGKLPVWEREWKEMDQRLKTEIQKIKSGTE
jgi:hypothetical protein